MGGGRVSTLADYLAMDLGGPLDVTGLSPAAQAARDAAFFGEDIWYAAVHDDGSGEYVITPAGDLQVAVGREALRQALIRRLITDPDEWPTLPDYGVGARRWVKGKNTATQRAELESRVRAQFARDQRVESVNVVLVAQLDDGSPGVKVTAQVTPRGRLRGARALAFTTEVR